MRTPSDEQGLWSSRNFKLLVASQIVNVTGDMAMILVLALWVKEITDSNRLASLVYLAGSVPVIAGPLVGVFVDRLNHRRTLIAVDVVLMIVTLALVGAHDRHGLWIVYMVTFALGTGDVIYQSARVGLVALTVPEKHLPDANGVLTAVAYGLQVVAPILGVAIYATFGMHGTAMLDAGTFAISAALLSLIRMRPGVVAPKKANDFRAELREGWQYLSRDAVDVRTMTVAFAAAYGAIGLNDIATFPMIQDGLHRSPRLVGWILAVRGAATIAGGLTAGPIIRRFGERRVAGNSLLIAVVAFGAFIWPSIVGVFAGTIAFGVGLGWFASAYMTLVQRRTPTTMLARVTSTGHALGSVLYVSALGLGSWLVPLLGFQPFFVAVSVICGGCGIWLLTSREPAPSPPL